MVIYVKMNYVLGDGTRQTETKRIVEARFPGARVIFAEGI